LHQAAILIESMTMDALYYIMHLCVDELFVDKLAIYGSVCLTSNCHVLSYSLFQFLDKQLEATALKGDFFRPLQLFHASPSSGKLDIIDANGTIFFDVYIPSKLTSYPLFETIHRGQFHPSQRFYDQIEIPRHHAIMDGKLMPIDIRSCSKMVNRFISLIVDYS
jgi:hypothetical protein